MTIISATVSWTNEPNLLFCVSDTPTFNFIFAGGHEAADLMQLELLPAYKSWVGASDRPYVVSVRI